MASVPRPASRRKPKTPAVEPRLQIVTNTFTLDVPDSARTFEGFRAWATQPDFPERVRVMFFQGEVWLDMSNEEMEPHNKVKSELIRAILTLTEELDLGEFYSDGVLVSNEPAGVSNNPEAFLVLHETITSRRVQLTPRKGEQGHFIELVGTPDWVLEIVSESSVTKDTRTLRQAYHAAGIPEYWIIDARSEQIEFQILRYRKSGYVASPIEDGWQHSRIFDRYFRLERSKSRSNLNRYRLQVRE